MELGTDLSEQALLIYTFIKIRLIFWGTDFSDVLDMMLFSVLSLYCHNLFPLLGPLTLLKIEPFAKNLSISQ